MAANISANLDKYQNIIGTAAKDDAFLATP